MKKTTIIIICLLASFAAFAQEVRTVATDVPQSENMPVAVANDESAYLDGMVPVYNLQDALTEKRDSLRLPTLNFDGRMPVVGAWHHPYIGGFWGWRLHEGMNVNIGLSAFTSFGKNAFSGTAERIAGMYAKALNKHLSVAVGGYFNNMNSGIGDFRQAGLTAVLNYRFDEHWEAFVYGQKSISSSASNLRFPHHYFYDPYCLPQQFGDRIGAGVRYNFNPSTSVEVQFEWAKPNDSFHNSLQNRTLMPGQKAMP